MILLESCQYYLMASIEEATWNLNVDVKQIAGEYTSLYHPVDLGSTKHKQMQ